MKKKISEEENAYRMKKRIIIGTMIGVTILGGIALAKKIRNSD